MKEKTSHQFKQRLIRIHAAAGITFSLLMYIALFFGIFAIYLPYIQAWEKPSRHIQLADITKINYENVVDQILQEPSFPKNNILLTLPGVMGDPALKVSHRFVKPIYFDPFSGEKLKDEGTQSHLASFLNEMHYGKPLDFSEEYFGKTLKYFGRLLFGFMSIGVMLVVISGLMMIIYLKYRNTGKTPKSYFSKMHIKIFTWIFPVFFIITLSGAFMNISLISSAPMADMLTKGEQKTIDSIIGPALFPRVEPIKPFNENVAMTPINELIKKAKNIAPDIDFQQITLINWKDKSARIELKGYNPYYPFLNGGVFNKPKVVLNGLDGSLISYSKVMDRSWSVYVAEAIFFLHFLFGVDIFTRTLTALLMAAGAVAVGFGVLLWLEKQTRVFNKKVEFYHWMGRLSLAVIIGSLPATALMFNLQWLLPFDLVDRVHWQQGLFYNAWLATMFWSFFRINSYIAAKELLALGGVLFVASTFIHLGVLKITPLYLIQNGMGNIISVDIALFIFGVVLIYIAKKLPSNRDKAHNFWKIKKEIKNG